MEQKYMIKNKGKAIEEPTKEIGIWTFADTKRRVDKKVSYTWNSLFQAFQDKEFLMLLQDDAIIEIRKEVYQKIIKSGVHQAAVKTLILPCPDVIEWITRKIDHQHQLILNYEGRSVSYYKYSIFNKMYNLKEASIKVSPEWLKQKNESAQFMTILKGWWSKQQFRTKHATVEWKTVQIIEILLSRVFGREDGSTFLDKWIPIIYQIITSGAVLNCGEMISSNLDNQFKKIHKEHQFYMSTYLMNVICASLEFPSLGWKWESSMPSVSIGINIWTVSNAQPIHLGLEDPFL